MFKLSYPRNSSPISPTHKPLVRKIGFVSLSPARNRRSALANLNGLRTASMLVYLKLTEAFSTDNEYNMFINFP